MEDKQPIVLTTKQLFIKRLKDFTAGSIAGFACKVVEYPFDTVKVLLQTQKTNEFKGPIHCFFSVLRTQGPGRLYRGLASPIVGSMFENAVLFSSFEFMKENLPKVSKVFDHELFRAACSGAFAGVAVAYVLTPVELIKCRLQVIHPDPNLNFKGPIDCLVKTVKNEGISKGLYKGTLTYAKV